MKLSWPNRLTVARILLIVPLAVLLVNLQQWAAARRIALVLFGLMGLTDVLDGYLARVRNQQSRLGYFLDPAADKLLILCTCVFLALPKTCIPGAQLPGWAAIAIVGKDVLWALGVLVIVLISGRIRITPSLLGKLATLTQFATVLAILAYPEFPPHAGWFLTRILWSLAAGLAVGALLDYTHLASRLLVSTMEKNNSY